MAEDALHKHEKDSSPDVVVLVDHEPEEPDENEEEKLKLIGYTRDQILGEIAKIKQNMVSRFERLNQDPQTTEAYIALNPMYPPDTQVITNLKGAEIFFNKTKYDSRVVIPLIPFNDNSKGQMLKDVKLNKGYTANVKLVGDNGVIKAYTESNTLKHQKRMKNSSGSMETKLQGTPVTGISWENSD